jgi:hypothetical protein
MDQGTNKDPTTLALPLARSRPIDSGTVSFLILIGEIRNAIYDILFDRGELRLSFQYTESAQSLTPTPPIYGVNLPATCRQINEEASPCLYSRNNIVFFPEPQDCARGCRNYFFMPNKIDKWLLGIGRQRALVRDVAIDLRALCVRCTPSDDRLPLHALLRQILLVPSRKLSINILQSTSRLEDVVRGSVSSPIMPDSPLNNALAALDLRRGSPFRSIVLLRSRFEIVATLDGAWLSITLRGGGLYYRRSSEW